MQLSEQQMRYFETFGFLIFPGLLAGEAGAIAAAFEQVWAEHGSGHDGREHDRRQRSALVPFIDHNEYLSALLDDPRIEGIASSLLGDDFNYTGSDGNFYVGDTGWHSDWRWPEERGTNNRQYLSIKMAFYLDPVTRDSGCLRVVPGSHLVGDGFADVLQDTIGNREAGGSDALFAVHGSEVPAFALESRQGDVVVFNHSLKHGSWGGGDRRRMFTINQEQRYLEEDVGLLREQMAKLSRFWIERAYGDVMIRTAGPRRMRHLEQRLANDDHLPELARNARMEMDEPARG